MNRTVIIDGDVIVYKCAEAIAEHIEVETDEDQDSLYQTISWGSKSEAKNLIKKKIKEILKVTKSTEAVICLSDAEENFRKDLLPHYKSNRKKVKPVFYHWIRKYFHDNYTTFERPTLEADDLMGIIVTYPKKLKGISEGEKVLWSMDKDFKTIPCTFYREKPNKEITVHTTSLDEANYYFMFQTLTGDPVDGYEGCKNIGVARARKLLAPFETECNLEEAWLVVKDAYLANGFTEQDALTQARCARILRAEDYDFGKKEVKLWNML